MAPGTTQNRWGCSAGAIHKWHVRVILQNGERVYLNLLLSETAQRSRITARAAAKLGRENEEDGHMHLKGMDGKEVAIPVNVVDTFSRLASGEVLPAGKAKPDMVLSEEDVLRLKGMMLTGWKTEDDHLKGWASQGVRRERVTPGTRGRVPEKRSVGPACAKYLQMKVGRRITGINVLFNRSVPDTVIRYGAAARAGLRAGRRGQWVTSVEGEREYTKGVHIVPVVDLKGHVQLARDVECTATTETRGVPGGAQRGLPGAGKETSRVSWEWELTVMIIGRVNRHCKPALLRGCPREGVPLEAVGPAGLYTTKDLEGLGKRN